MEPNLVLVRTWTEELQGRATPPTRHLLHVCASLRTDLDQGGVNGRSTRCDDFILCLTKQSIQTQSDVMLMECFEFRGDIRTTSEFHSSSSLASLPRSARLRQRHQTSSFIRASPCDVSDSVNFLYCVILFCVVCSTPRKSSTISNEL